MPVVDDRGLRLFDKSDLRYKHAVQQAKDLLARRRQKRRQEMERLEQETVLELRIPKKSKKAKKAPVDIQDLTVHEWIAQKAAERPGKMTRIEEGFLGANGLTGICREYPDGTPGSTPADKEAAWEAEVEWQWSPTTKLEKRVEAILAAIGYSASVKQNSDGLVFVGDLWFEPETHKATGALKRAQGIHDSEGLEKIFKKFRLKATWDWQLMSYLVTK